MVKRGVPLEMNLDKDLQQIEFTVAVNLFLSLKESSLDLVKKHTV
jgi:hypothetical protein